jgi:hypothetical protein
MIKNLEMWKEFVDKNTDSYGKCCVDVARQVMKILDDEYVDKKKIEPKDTHSLICRADDEIKAGGITGFMAGCVSSMVSQVHSMGDEWRKAWNIDNQIGTEGEKANKKKKAVLNPALISVSTKK